MKDEVARLLESNALLRQICLAYEQWEADLIMDNKAWSGRAFPIITEALWDRLLEIQTRRNAALAISDQS